MLATWVSVALLLPGIAVAQATDEVGHRHMPVERIPSPPGVRAVWLPPADMLYNNGAVADGTEASCSGDDGNPSILQTALGGASLGFNAGSSASLDFRLADDFVIPAGPSWAVSSAYMFAYQTGSGNTSTITGINVRIWNGPPSNAASTVVCGDTSSSAMTATAFSGIFRMADSALDCSRPIMVETVDLSGCPTVCDDAIEPRHVDLRPFAITGKSSWVLPGGLSRVALKKGTLIVNSSQGGGSTDTWVLEGGAA